jgi:hypothetical protein
MSEAPLPERLDALAAAGWLRADAFSSRREELSAVREVARRGLGAGRVFDGHRNALERLLEHRPEDVRLALRDEIARGELRLGVWGADPGPGEGDPACLDEASATVTGTKVFCSGAGRLDLAIVLVRRAAGSPPILPVLVDLRDPAAARTDERWFQSHALAESHSHRVVFQRAPVRAVLGSEGTLSEEPWISGDALRSSGVWAGAADAIVERMVAEAPGDGSGDERLGRAVAILGTVDAWLEAGLSAIDAAHGHGTDPAPTIGALRLELTERLRALARLAAEHGGSRRLVTDAALAEARAGLDILLLQHRLDPVAIRVGNARRVRTVREPVPAVLR